MVKVASVCDLVVLALSVCGRRQEVRAKWVVFW